MKKFLNIVLCLVCLSLFSCNDEFNTKNESEVIETSTVVTKDGYLSFTTAADFQYFLGKIRNGENPGVSSNTRGGQNFESIASLSQKCNKLKSVRSDNQQSPVESDELEEMTEEEYNVAKAERLIFDNILTHVMDTTLRICVEGILYKVTPLGTFFVDSNRQSLLADAETNVYKDSCLVAEVAPGESITLPNGVGYINSFGNVDTEEALIQSEEDNDNSNTCIMPSPLRSDPNEFHLSYNVDSYTWKNNNYALAFLDWVRGKDVSKSKEIKKNFRVVFNIFDVNYGYYKSAGIKVKLQQRKTYLLVPIWTEIKAEKLAIGFNYMDGELTYSNPMSFSSLIPANKATWPKYQQVANGMMRNFIYGTYKNLKFIQDWTNEIIACLPEIEIGDTNYVENVLNKIYNTAPSQAYAITKSLAGKYVYTPYTKKVMPTDPMMLYLIYGNTKFTFNKEHPYISGIQEYFNAKSKSVIFDRSFGFIIAGPVIAPYTPTNFDIKKIDAFGAAKYEGKWYGIRFYGKQ